MLKNLIFVFSLFLSSISFIQAQSLSNKGKEFWVGYGSHVAMYELDRISIPNTNQTQPNPNAGKPLVNGGDQNMVLYFTSDRNSTVTVEIPGLNWGGRYYSFLSGEKWCLALGKINRKTRKSYLSYQKFIGEPG
jgi:hypothetical protein